jgi:CheY-like chemotaxis protein
MNSVSLLLGVSLLAVEDDPDTRQMMGRILGNAGAKVFLASSALEAFKIFKEQQPDLLISDISMPGYSGYDLISMIRCLPEEQGGHVPAIAFTAHAHSNDKTQILGRGFDMQISKPVDGHELVLQIAQLLRKN